MKKIVTIALVAMMCAAIFAVDVSTSMRIGFNAFSIDKLGDDAAVTRWFDLNYGSAAKNNVHNEQIAADAFTFTAGGQAGGFKINLNPLIYKLGSTDLWNKAKDMNFYLGWGAFKLSAGKWGDGVFYAEQCKKDHDDTNWSGQGSWAGLYKMGLTAGNYGKAFDNLTGVNGSALLTLFAEYKLAKVLPGNLYFTVALNDLSTQTKVPTDFDNDATDKTFFQNAIGFRVAYQQNKVVNVNVDFRLFNDKVMGFGIYASPLMVKGLSATLGFTMIIDSNDTAKDNGFGIDARFRYEVIKGLTLTNQFNFTSLTDGDGRQCIFDSFFALYKINSTIWASFDYQFDKNAIANKKTYHYITPGCVIVAGDGCQLTTGVQFAIGKPDSGDAVTSLAVPVIMRVKF